MHHPRAISPEPSDRPRRTPAVRLALALPLLLTLALQTLGADRTPPLIVYRVAGGPTRNPQTFREQCRLMARYRGTIDEVWYGGARPLCRLETVREELRRVAAFREDLDRAGVALSFQQGLTLGHDYCYRGTPGNTVMPAGVYPPAEVHPFPDSAWKMRRDGSRARYALLCPRAPEVLAYERAYVKEVLQALDPKVYWLDDDLRLGVGAVECWCPRCLEAFNRANRTNLSRQELIAIVHGSDELSPLREAWIRFCAKSLEGYARTVRQAADEYSKETRLGLQSVSADDLCSGPDYLGVLRELSGDGRVPAGIRPGHGYYRDEHPLGLLEKLRWVAREAERSRPCTNWCATVCYEQETYPRLLLHKSPRAIVTECVLALAAGCDTLSLYYASGESPERPEPFGDLLAELSRVRPYLEHLSALARTTTLGGLARYPGGAVLRQRGLTLDDPEARDIDLWRAGIPVTVAESSAPHKVWWVTPRSRRAFAEGDRERLAREGFVAFPALAYPTESLRKSWLDELDRLTGTNFPVRLESTHPICLLPRQERATGKLRAVTLLNLSIGDVDRLDLRLRNPASTNLFWRTPQHPAPIPLTHRPGAVPGEIILQPPLLGGWQVGTITCGL